MGPLRWPLCRNALGGLEEMGDRQREWPHEAQARFALVVHALPVKGGDKVYHRGGGIVYHRHDEKELNWEPGRVR